MKKRWLVAIAVVAFLATLALRAPANLTYARVLGAVGSSDVALHGVHGTLSRGGMAQVSIDQRPVLRDVRWTLQPLWLPLLRVTADLEAADPVARVRVSRSVFGTVRLSDLNASGNVKSLLALFRQGGLPVDGQARMDLPLLRFSGRVPIEAEGSIELENLTWTLAREPLVLGSFNAAATTALQGIQVNFGSGPGPLEVGGTALLTPTREYELDLQLRPRPAAPAQLMTLVQSLGPADAQGWHHLRRKGVLP